MSASGFVIKKIVDKRRALLKNDVQQLGRQIAARNAAFASAIGQNVRRQFFQPKEYGSIVALGRRKTVGTSQLAKTLRPVLSSRMYVQDGQPQIRAFNGCARIIL